MSKNWNWAAKREKKSFIALEDGTIFRGFSIGAPKDTLGEVVFNTGMTGYQEILTDPSYNGQIVTMTYTEIGNYGINPDDMESRQAFANGFLIHELNRPRNWRSTVSLQDYFLRNDITAMECIDTRALTIKLRNHGTMKSFMSVTGEVSEEKAVAKAKEWIGLDGQDYASKVTCGKTFQWDPDGIDSSSWGTVPELPKADLKIVAYDFGVKWNILRRMRQQGMNVTVVPATTSPEDVLALKPGGVFLSNGPADPAAVTYAAENIRTLFGKIPMMGICLGHQLLGLALGGSTYRLKFGHHGCNHPVKDLATGKVEITSQNHNFCVDPSSLDNSKVEVTHINLNDQSVEGIRCRKEPVFSVQYHPEAAPGPFDSTYLFERFRNMIKEA